MALLLTQPLTEMSTRNTSWGYRQPVLSADNLTNLVCWLSWNLGAKLLESSGLVQTCIRITLPLHCIIKNRKCSTYSRILLNIVVTDCSFSSDFTCISQWDVTCKQQKIDVKKYICEVETARNHSPHRTHNTACNSVTIAMLWRKISCPGKWIQEIEAKIC
jgi:hypothetical protein